MKTYRILSIILLAGLVSACQVNEPAESAATNAPRYHATAESAVETRTSLVRQDGMAKVVWNTDDRISVFAKSTLNRQYRFTGKDGATSGDFEEVTGASGSSEALSMSYAVYPYSEAYSISTDGVVSLTWPAVQHYRTGNYDSSAAIMLARSANEELSFLHASGYLCISLYGEGINVGSVTLTAEGEQLISGPATIRIEQEGKAETVKTAFQSGATGSITLTAASPVAIGSTGATATEFWFCIPPVEFEQGFTVTVKDDGGRETVFSTAKSIKVERAKMTRMEPVRFDLNGAAPTAPGIYFADGTTTAFSAPAWQLSCYRAGGQAWLRAIDLENMSAKVLGPVPAALKIGLVSSATLEEFAFATPENKTEKQLTLRVVAMGDHYVTFADGDNNYYVMRF